MRLVLLVSVMLIGCGGRVLCDAAAVGAVAGDAAPESIGQASECREAVTSARLFSSGFSSVASACADGGVALIAGCRVAGGNGSEDLVTVRVDGGIVCESISDAPDASLEAVVVCCGP